MVGDSDGRGVGDGEGIGDGIGVGGRVGPGVGLWVGAEVGVAVGSAVGACVGTGVGAGGTISTVWRPTHGWKQLPAADGAVPERPTGTSTRSKRTGHFGSRSSFTRIVASLRSPSVHFSRFATGSKCTCSRATCGPALAVGAKLFTTKDAAPSLPSVRATITLSSMPRFVQRTRRYNGPRKIPRPQPLSLAASTRSLLASFSSSSHSVLQEDNSVV